MCTSRAAAFQRFLAIARKPRSPTRVSLSTSNTSARSSACAKFLPGPRKLGAIASTIPLTNHCSQLILRRHAHLSDHRPRPKLSAGSKIR